MTIGSLLNSENSLFVGVHDGANPSSANPYLLQHGIEIYDTQLPLSPIRLAQIHLQDSVTGMGSLDNLLVAAVNSQGIVIVDKRDTSSPYIVDTISLGAYDAKDVAIHSAKPIAAISASNDLGDGYVRFIDLTVPTMRRR